MGKGHRSRDTSRRSRVLCALTLPEPFANGRTILIPTRHAFAVSLVGSLIALVVALNDLARILLQLGALG